MELTKERYIICIMKKFPKLLIVNFVIFIFLIIYLILGEIYREYVGILLIIMTFCNIYFIYLKSNTFDKNEVKKKLILHKVKNSLSTILAYNEAVNDNLIDRDEFEENLKLEIDEIVKVIRDEIYK